MTSQDEYIAQRRKELKRGFKAMIKKVRGKHKPVGIKSLGFSQVEDVYKWTK